MSTDIRPEVSKKNKYYISKDRYYELKHFCLQYNDWKRAYLSLSNYKSVSDLPEIITKNSYKTSVTERVAIAKDFYSRRVSMVEEAAIRADIDISTFILMAVTDNVSCTALITKYNMPCGKDKFYDSYRRFFWHLSQLRE